MASSLECLPDDLVFKILAENLSAEDIHDSARLVCRKWYHMTKIPSFAYSHLRHTDCGLLFTKWLDDQTLISISVLHDGRVETSERRNTFGIICGCNGLMLSHTRRDSTLYIVTLYIVNPVTKKNFPLPPILGLNRRRCSLAYNAVSKEYKVVVRHAGPVPDSERYIDCWSILTVGVDNSWRRISDTHFSFEAKEAFWGIPLVTGGGGFLHWCDYGLNGNQVLTMDVETEILRETPLPPLPPIYKKRWVLLSTGKYLSLLVCCREHLWEVWEMKPQTGEWRKVAMLSLEAWKRMFQRPDLMNTHHLVPIGWLTYPDVLVFGFFEGRVFLYNFVTQEMESIQLPRQSLNYTPFVHRSSLVWV